MTTLKSVPETMTDRAKQADMIIRSPEEYKICSGCDSILKARVPICPNCATFRFEEEPSEIKAQARRLGSRLRTTVISADLV